MEPIVLTRSCWKNTPCFDGKKKKSKPLSIRHFLMYHGDVCQRPEKFFWNSQVFRQLFILVSAIFYCCWTNARSCRSQRDGSRAHTPDAWSELVSVSLNLNRWFDLIRILMEIYEIPIKLMDNLIVDYYFLLSVNVMAKSGVLMWACPLVFFTQGQRCSLLSEIEIS